MKTGVTKRKNLVLVLTHTDVLKDGRIVKSIEAFLGLDNINVFAVGVKSSEVWVETNLKNERLRVVSLPGRRQKPWPIVALVKTSRLWGMLRFFRRKIRESSMLGPWRKNFWKIVKTLSDGVRGGMFSLLIIGVVLVNVGLSRPRMIYCNDEYVLSAGSLLKKLFKSTLIYDAHELEHNKNGQGEIRKKATFELEKLCWPHVDHFVTVSEAIRRHYLALLGPKPSTVVLNAPQISSSNGPTRLREDVKASQDELILVYVGSLTKGRGIEFLLGFAKVMPPNWRLVFVGEGPLAELVSGFASSLPRVHLVGPIRHDWLVDYISSADIGVCLAEPVSLSDELALPNKFFEYAFAGLPIVYSPFPEMERVGQSFNLGLSSPLDFGIFREGVDKLAGQRVSLSDLSDLSSGSQREKLQQLALKYT